MKFFEAQDKAKSRTFWLILLTLLGVAAISSLLLFVFYFTLVPDWRGCAILTAIVSGSMFLPTFLFAKLSAQSGFDLAMNLGGIPLLQKGILIDDREIRLRNVVEEMAIASGLPIPDIFVMKGESSINAFAAGIRPGEYVVAVTQGCLDHLSREELQSVVAHEFAHILNEDMSLAQNLAVMTSGFLQLTKLGSRILNTRSRGKGAAQIMLIGAAFMVLGSLGRLWASLMQATISRQREFFADACSAQFTRNPEALAKALAKIKTMAGSLLNSDDRFTYAHIFFASSLEGSFFSFSTHPRIEDRIQALVPRIPAVEFIERAMIESTPKAKPQVSTLEKLGNIDQLLQNAGCMTAASLLASQKFLSGNKDFLNELRNPERARMVLSLLIMKSQPNGEAIEKYLYDTFPESRNLKQQLEQACGQDEQSMNFVFHMVCGSLHSLSLSEKQDIFNRLSELFKNDDQLSLLEVAYLACLQNIFKLEKVKSRISFRQAEQRIGVLFTLQPWDGSHLAEILTIFNQLQLLSLREKEVFLRTIGKHFFTSNQIEAYRVFALAIGVPLPPMPVKTWAG